MLGTKRTFLLYNKQKLVVMNKIKHLQVYRNKEIDWKMYLLMKNRLHTDSISDHRQRSEKLKNSAAGRLGLSEARCIASQPRIVFTNGNKMEDSQEGKALSRPFYRRSLKLHNSLSWASLFLVWHLWKEIQTFHFCWKMKAISFRSPVAFSSTCLNRHGFNRHVFLSQSIFVGFVERKALRKIHCTIPVYVREVLNLYIKTGM